MQPTPPSQPVAASRRLFLFASGLRIVLWVVVACWVLFAAGLAALHGWIVPRIAEFRPLLEQHASVAIGAPVRIGQISARAAGLQAVVELADVTVQDALGATALRVPRIVTSISPGSVWRRGVEQLAAERVEIDVRRAADGQIFIGGLPLPKSGSSGQPRPAADWLFSQPELSISSATVRWTDEQNPQLSAAPVSLTNVNWLLRNTARSHASRLDATPPAEWGAPFSLRGKFTQPLLARHAGDFATWSGQFFVEATQTDLAEVSRHASQLWPDVAVRAGTGALRAWLDVTDGDWTGGLADVALAGVNVTLGRTPEKRLAPLMFESISGRIGSSRRADGFDFSTESLGFKLADGLQWPGGNIAVTHRYANGRKPEQTTLKGEQLELQALREIASRLPISAASRQAIDDFAPTGLVESLRADWQGPVHAPITLAAVGRVSNLQLAPGVVATTAVSKAPLGSSKVPLPKISAPADPIGRPGISGAAVDFDVTHEGGQAKLSIQNGAIDFPGVFDDARVPFTQLSTDASWKTAGGNIELQLRNVQFANADAAGQAQVTWRRGPLTELPPLPAKTAPGPGKPDHRALGVIDLQGSLSRADGARVHRYLPLVLPTDVRRYVQEAVVKGALSDVAFNVKGAVGDIPFAGPKRGDFRIAGKVAGAQLAYVPAYLQSGGDAPWPALTDLNGELVFMRAGLQLTNAKARVAGLAGLQIVKGAATIADLTQGATVEVQLDAQGALADALGFVNTSPLSGLTSGALANAVGTGEGQYRFKLALPLATLAQSQVTGTVTLPGNAVQFAPGTPALTGLRGSVAVTERGFTVNGAEAQLLGGAVRIDGGTRGNLRSGGAGPATGSAAVAPVAPNRDDGVFFKAQGTLTAEGLRQFKDSDAVPRLAQHASGSTDYAATLDFRRGGVALSIDSSLQGLALDLPAPLGKAADTALPLHFESAPLGLAAAAPGGETTGSTARDQLSLRIGNVAALRYLRDVSSAQPRVLRGGIGIGTGIGTGAAELLTLPDSGVAANVNLPRVDIDAWSRIVDKSAALPARTVAIAPDKGAATGAATPLDAQIYLPTTVAIRAGEVTVQGRKLNNVVAGGTRDGELWRVNVDSNELNGYIEAGPTGSNSAGRVYGRLARLRLAPAAVSEVETILDAQPANIPSLDIVIDDFELRGKRLGRIEIDAVNRVSPGVAGGREWRLNKLNVVTPEAVFTATGSWAAAPGESVAASILSGTASAREKRRTEMNFKLDIADSGELLKRFGMDGVIRRGKGTLEGQVGWAGSPLGLDYPSLSGQFKVEVESGQFVKADPGIAKLLGVLSLQSLPRRLTLDFRDVFSEGFAFDFVRGDVTIERGTAQTNNLQMRGVNAAVLMDGRANIARETQDIRVVVVPEINAGTASLIATAINPAIGLGTFLAQLFLRKPLMEAATQEFHIDGTWTDPKITKVERRMAVPQ